MLAVFLAFYWFWWKLCSQELWVICLFSCTFCTCKKSIYPEFQKIDDHLRKISTSKHLKKLELLKSFTGRRKRHSKNGKILIIFMTWKCTMTGPPNYQWLTVATKSTGRSKSVVPVQVVIQTFLTHDTFWLPIRNYITPLIDKTLNSRKRLRFPRFHPIIYISL
jgi:hypothetical protein